MLAYRICCHRSKLRHNVLGTERAVSLADCREVALVGTDRVVSKRTRRTRFRRSSSVGAVDEVRAVDRVESVGQHRRLRGSSSVDAADK